MTKPARFVGKPRLVSIEYEHDPSGQPIVELGEQGIPKFTFEQDYEEQGGQRKTAIIVSGPDNISESGFALRAYAALVDAWEGKV